MREDGITFDETQLQHAVALSTEDMAIVRRVLMRLRRTHGAADHRVKTTYVIKDNNAASRVTVGDAVLYAYQGRWRLGNVRRALDDDGTECEVTPYAALHGGQIRCGSTAQVRRDGTWDAATVTEDKGRGLFTCRFDDEEEDEADAAPAAKRTTSIDARLACDTSWPTGSDVWAEAGLFYRRMEYEKHRITRTNMVRVRMKHAADGRDAEHVVQEGMRVSERAQILQHARKGHGDDANCHFPDSKEAYWYSFVTLSCNLSRLRFGGSSL